MDLQGYKSTEERYFSYWLDELVEAGFIEGYKYEETTWNLSHSERYTREKHLKTKIKEETRSLIGAHLYGCDFTITFTDKAYYYFFEYIHSIKLVQNIHVPFFICPYSAHPDITEAYIEVKPAFDQNNMTMYFKLSQKWVFKEYGDFVNLIVPIAQTTNCLFAKTFTPKKVILEEVYKRTHKSGKYVKGQSKLKYPLVLSLKEYLGEVRHIAKAENWLHILEPKKSKRWTVL